MRRAIAAALLAGALAACGRDAAPPPSAAPDPGGGRGLRPMTSRDGSEPAASLPGVTPALPPGHPPVDRGAAAAPASGPAVSGTVSLAPRLQDRQGAALFIIARSSSSGQILAVRKEDDARFPHAFRISGADAMTEGTAFVGPFDVTARLSKTGDAMPGNGDIEGTAKGVAAGARDVTITLDSVRQ